MISPRAINASDQRDIRACATQCRVGDKTRYLQHTLNVHGDLQAILACIRGMHTCCRSGCGERGTRRSGNERAQPSGSSWRPSRMATRLYCSNKSYHPAITALITFPRDEYILACSVSLSSLRLFLRPAAISCSIRVRCALCTTSSSRVVSLYVFLLIPLFILLRTRRTTSTISSRFTFSNVLFHLSSVIRATRVPTYSPAPPGNS